MRGRGPDGAKRVAIGRHAVTPAEKARWAAAALARIGAEAEPPSDPGAGGTPTVAELARRYLREGVAVRCEPPTAGGYRQVPGTHVVPVPGTLPVAAIRRAQVAELRHRPRKTPATANEAVGGLRAAAQPGGSPGEGAGGEPPAPSGAQAPHAKARALRG